MFRSQRLHFGNREIDYQFFEEAKITHLESRLVGKKASHHLRELKVSTSALIRPQTTNRVSIRAGGPFGSSSTRAQDNETKRL